MTEPHILERAGSLLRDAPARTLPLDTLLERLGWDTGTARHRLADLLARDRRFALAGGSDPLDALPLGGDPDTRERYRTALRAASPDTLRVILVEPDGGEATATTDTVALLDASLRQLRFGADLPGFADRVAEAQAEYGALARLVTPQAE